MAAFGWGLRPKPISGLYARPSLLLFAAINKLIIAHVYSHGEGHHRERS